MPTHPHPPIQTPVPATRSFVMHVPVPHLTLPLSRGEKTGAGKDGQGGCSSSSNLEMRPARLRRNQGRLTAEHYPTPCVFAYFGYVFLVASLSARLHYTHTHTHTQRTYALHTCTHVSHLQRARRKSRNVRCAAMLTDRSITLVHHPIGGCGCVSATRKNMRDARRGTHPHHSTTDYLPPSQNSYVRLIIPHVRLDTDDGSLRCTKWAVPPFVRSE